MNIKKLMKLWMENFGKVSKNNEMMGKMLLFSLLGAYINKHDYVVHGKDTRIHLFVVSQSRTGKGKSFGFFKEVAERMGLTVKKALKYTEAGLIGGINQVALELAMKKAKKEGLDFNSIDPDEYIEYGDFYDADVLMANEGTVLFTDEDLLNIFQEVMDYPAEIRKRLRTAEIKYQCKTTVLASSYYFDKIKEVVVSKGFFQRMLVLMRKVSPKQREKMLVGVIDDEDFNSVDYEALANEIKKVVDENMPKEKKISIEKSVKEELKKLINMLRKTIENDFTGTEREVLLSFMPTFLEYLIKMSGICAIIDGRDKVHKKDLRYVMLIMPAVWVSIFVELNKKIQQEDTALLKAVKLVPDSGITRKDYVNLLMNKYNISKSKAYSIAKDAIEGGFIEVKDGLLKKKINSSSEGIIYKWITYWDEDEDE